MGKSRPHVILNAATSIDGKLSTKTGESKFSSVQDLKRVHRLRNKVDAILIGTNTLKIDNPTLSVRHVKGKNPIRIILDSNGLISSNSKIIKTCNTIPTIVVVSRKISKKNLKRLESFCLEVIKSGKNKINLKLLLELLYKKGINTLLVEGGGKINWEFIKHGCFDEVIITITPYLIGGESAVSLVDGKGFKKITRSMKLNLDSVQHQGNEVVLKYSKL
ncbi:MAG: 2,5-diamino-6-(ribosylamino)-4(3H)-pyrimidinone 5'-phosphate reductase [Nitrosopumilaceae archaeon]|nr:2,5-diamino-6-(ribosylamino)-4(3H)-pyrimidinone 5'-phosphate reductase [Nitrosopumilaceae archaeon]NIT99931.1 2,5-diamino-6-(ribosylamino)-4(3H)-pyrimidinone 5'-phosphate reductase [Nitrosopumilaceae archaeon]NIU86285.1 2,5-diamino-6-(ribosylamino)-4(3H)-pyrimidinone 5'-phosphate reductase [Nitrosopumilaceae archaeon]NIV65040.1 2,5-diamino-6-(ribosylamino)-4(3H)-pyrimidinone 5'-phosphate reductase [Nitrosopumilaceae archaeon]NIX60534.1 2,5-diamino-6-(ribosylamino)-4(3H)-pyrimidinone 5'-phosp